MIHAKKNSIPIKFIDTKSRNYENLIINFLRNYKIDLICLAGYMKIIPKRFLLQFKKTVLNIHPSLLPKYKGLNTYERILKNGEKKTGCSVHFVNEKLDGGNIILQKSFHIKSVDDVKSLKKKTQRLEYLAYPEAIIKIFKSY